MDSTSSSKKNATEATSVAQDLEESPHAPINLNNVHAHLVRDSQSHIALLCAEERLERLDREKVVIMPRYAAELNEAIFVAL